MLRRILSGVALLLFAVASYSQAYTWVDEDGVVHYSDRPVPGAEQILLSTKKGPGRSLRGTARPAARTSAEKSTATTPTTQKPFSYSKVAVASPGAEETLWNIGGVLKVAVNLQPGLQPGHRLRVYFDGEPRLQDGLSFELQEVHRGVHNLQVEILDQTGALMIRSIANRFYVQQNTVVGN